MFKLVWDKIGVFFPVVIAHTKIQEGGETGQFLLPSTLPAHRTFYHIPPCNVHRLLPLQFWVLHC